MDYCYRKKLCSAHFNKTYKMW